MRRNLAALGMALAFYACSFNSTVNGSSDGGGPIDADNPATDGATADAPTGIDAGMADAGLPDATPPTDAGSPVDAVPPAPVEVEFRDGLGGYAGTLDTYVSTEENGQSFGGESTIIVDGKNDDLGRTFGFLQFTNIFGSGTNEIPSGATIVSAQLEFTVVDQSAGDQGFIGRFTAAWNESSTASQLAGVLGGSIEPEDFVGLLPLTAGVFTIDVTSVVESWHSGAVTNNGFVFVPQSEDGLDIASREFGTATSRPTLRVTYQP